MGTGVGAKPVMLSVGQEPAESGLPAGWVEISMKGFSGPGLPEMVIAGPNNNILRTQPGIIHRRHPEVTLEEFCRRNRWE